MTTNSFHSRIGDHAISFGMVRYSSGDTTTYHTEDALWKCIVSEHCGHKKLTAFEVTISDLVKIKSFCDQAIKMLKTDGDRIKDEPLDALAAGTGKEGGEK